MELIELRSYLTEILARMYEMEAFNSLAEFLQGELHVLQYLCRHCDAEINPSLLSDKLHVSRSRITAALSALRRKGFVTMEVSDEDRRRMRVLLTPEGASYLQSKQERVERYFDQLVQGLGEKNTRELTRLIELSIEIVGSGE